MDEDTKKIFDDLLKAQMDIKMLTAMRNPGLVQNLEAYFTAETECLRRITEAVQDLQRQVKAR